MKVKIVVFVVLSIGFAGNCAKQRADCTRCIRTEECSQYGELSKSEQDEWLKSKACDGREADAEIGAVYGFAPFAKGDYICCPTSSTPSYVSNGRQNSNIREKPNNSQESPSTGTELKFGYDDGIEPWNNNRPQNYNNFNNQGYRNNYGNNYPQNNNNLQFSQPRYQQQGFGFDPFWNNGPMFGKPFGGMFNPGFFPGQRQMQNPGNNFNYSPRNQNPSNNFNLRQGNQFAQYPQEQAPINNGRPQSSNRRSENVGSNNAGRQCPLTSIPPSIESGCCGLHADYGDRITDSQVADRPSQRNQNSWMPQRNNNFGGSSFPSWFSSPFSFFSDKDNAERQATNFSGGVIDIDNRITGGSATEVDQFPWLVLLKSTFDDGKEQTAFNCGGSLISSVFVLTAGHCLHDSNAQVVDVEVTMAEYDKRSFPRDCTNGEEGLRCIDNVRMYAQNVIVHPDYDDTKLQNDIALIRLQGKAPYTDFIRPICLPSGDIDSPEYKNLPLFVAGWGRDGIYNSNVKQSTVVNLVPQRECRKSYSFLTRRHVCAAGYSGQDTCKGDSGGPLMLNKNGKYFVIGIVSGKRADSPCGTSIPSLYTNVYHYLDWIGSIIRS